MPLNVRKFYASFLLILLLTIATLAQTTGDVMRDRISKAKAFIAVKNYNAAIYELENIRRETNDQTVQSVVSVLLMNSYLEQGDYKKAQDFLADLANPKKTGKQVPTATYYAVAGQVVRGARMQLERYKSLGLNVADRNLPKEAVADVDKMRETLEAVITQSKTLGADKKQSSDANALLEEATNVRSSLARDEFDATRWKNEAADAREMLANSRSVVINAVGDQMPDNNTAANQTPPNNNQTAANQTPPPNTNSASNNQAVQKESVPPLQPVLNNTNQTVAANVPENKKPDDAAKNGNDENPVRSRRVENTDQPNKPLTPNIAAETNADADKTPLEVGSLVNFATEKVNPIYPTIAKNTRTTGVVKVELTIDEDGRVAQVQTTSGPSMLQNAAKDAVKRWKFKPFKRDGQPVKATGYISFNFSL